MRDIHRYKKQFDNAKRNICESKDIKNRDKATVLELVTFIEIQDMSYGRAARYLWTIKHIAEMDLKHTLKRLDKSDLLIIAQNISQYSRHTRDEYRKALRIINKISLKDIPELPKIKDRKRHVSEYREKDEMERIIGGMARGSEEHDLTVFLWDTGARPGEGFNLKVKMVYPDSRGCRVKLTGKTGDRIIRILEYPEIILNRIKDKDPDEYVFNINYGPYLRALKRAAKKKGMIIKPYDIRHGRVNYLAPYMTSSVKRAYFGWGPSSKIPETYDHLNGDHIEPFLWDIADQLKGAPEAPQIPAAAVRPTHSVRVPVGMMWTAN